MNGEVIRYARQAHGLTQSGLARQVGTTQLSICQWETGKFQPQPHFEKRVKEVLGLCDVDILEIELLLIDEQHAEIKERLRKQAEL